MNVYRCVLSMVFLGGALHLSLANANNEIVAVVNGVEISRTTFEMLISTQASQGQSDTPAFKTNLLDVMITREVVAREATRRKLDKDPDVI